VHLVGIIKNKYHQPRVHVKIKYIWKLVHLVGIIKNKYHQQFLFHSSSRYLLEYMSYFLYFPNKVQGTICCRNYDCPCLGTGFGDIQNVAQTPSS